MLGAPPGPNPGGVSFSRTAQGPDDHQVVSPIRAATIVGTATLNVASAERIVSRPASHLFRCALLNSAESLADAMKERGFRSSWAPGGCWGCSRFTTREAPDGSVRGTAVRGDGSVSSPVGAGADDGRGGGAGAGPD